MSRDGSAPTQSARAEWAALIGLGGLSAAFYAHLGLGFPAHSTRQHLIWFLGEFAALFGLAACAGGLALRLGRRSPRATLAGLLAFAALFRLLLVFAGLPGEGRLSAAAADLRGDRVSYSPFLLYDDDVWRYLWDGHVQRHGFDPYQRSPAEWRERLDGAGPVPTAEAALLAHSADWDRLDNIRFPHYGTVYPPGAQLFARAADGLAPGSVFAWKTLLALADLATVVLLMRLLRHLGRPPAEAVWYAWNPLVVKEIAGSGHLEGLYVLLLVFAVERLVAGRSARGFAALAASITTKLTAAVLVPLALRHGGLRGVWALLAVGVLLGAPYAAGLPQLAANLAMFGADWAFNSGPWGLLAALFGLGGWPHAELAAHAVTKALLLGLVITVTLHTRREPRDLVHGAFLLLGATVLLHAAVMPWYLLWALPFAVAAGYRSWTVLTAGALLSYLIYLPSEERVWWRLVEFGAFALALTFELWHRPALRAELAGLLGLTRARPASPRTTGA